MNIYIFFAILIFINLYIILLKSNSSLDIIKKLLIGLVLFFICLFMCAVFGPWVYIDYSSCVPTSESNVSKDKKIYIRYKNGEYFSRYKYDAPFLCVSYCKDSIYEDRYKNINVDKIKLTGRVLKSYSLNAFGSRSVNVEIKLNGKRYWSSVLDYNYVSDKRLNVKSCSLFDIKDIKIIY